MEPERTVLLGNMKLPPKLFVLSRKDKFDVNLWGRQVLGRPGKSQTPDIPVASMGVSRQHGVFVTTPEGCTFKDQGSTNGTWLNGALLQPHVPVLLANGDVLRIHGRDDGTCELDVMLLYATQYRENARWETQALGPEIAEIAVGREEMLSLGSPSVSRRHASFFQAEKGWAVIDHGSLNGVFVNNRRLDRPVYLEPMDVIRIAEVFFLFTGDSLLYQAEKSTSPMASPQNIAPSPLNGEGLSIWIEERSVWQRAKKKTLLRHIEVQIDPGNMVLVLGGSGAGKTTFFNAVMGYEPAEGQITYRGIDIYDEYEKMKYEIGYVPQQDLLRMNDTVFATLLNAAKMRLPLGYAQYEQKVQETMDLLGLSRQWDTLVGKLSGGQRKRLSIAVEYIGNPSLFFLDEPDSGLDGTMAYALMENLRAIADRGKIVLVISHAPDRAFNLFDKVIVLAKSDVDEVGRLAFYGTPKDACSFFGVDTLEHIVKRINRPDEGGEGLADHFIERFERGGRA